MDYDDNLILNHSPNGHLQELIDARLTRRQALRGGIAVTATAMLGGQNLRDARCLSVSGRAAVLRRACPRPPLRHHPQSCH